MGLPAAVDYCATLVAQNRHREHRRAVITTTGRNQKGIVAKLTTVVAEHRKLFWRQVMLISALLLSACVLGVLFGLRDGGAGSVESGGNAESQ